MVKFYFIIKNKMSKKRLKKLTKKRRKEKKSVGIVLVRNVQ